MDKDHTLLYRIAFASIRGMGYDLAQKILAIIPSERNFFEIPEKELQSLLQTKVKMTEDSYRRDIIDKALLEIEFITKNDINVTYFTDDNYPARLVHAQDAPIILYSDDELLQPYPLQQPKPSHAQR